MKKTILSILAIVISAIYLNAQDLKLEQIIKKSMEVSGQEKMNSVQCIKMTGKLLTQGMEMPFTMIRKRPGKYRFDATVQNSTMVQAYNGTTGYTIMPWTGSNDPQDVTGDQLKSFRDQASIDSKFYKYQEAGAKVELIGKEDVNGKMAYHLKYTPKPENESEAPKPIDFFVDAQTFQTAKIIQKANINNNDMEVEVLLSNYKNVEGINFPGTIEQKVMGNTMVTLNFDEAVLNPPVEDSYFDKPQK